MKGFWIISLVLLSACSGEPRSTSYFAEHPQETAKVIAGCRDGSHRGQECQNAELAAANAERDRMIAKYREGLSR
jgi:hypothetical protein